MTRDELALKIGEITWFKGFVFFIETEDAGNYVWNDPALGGDNTMTPYSGSRTDFKHSKGMTTFKHEGVFPLGKKCPGFTLGR